MRIFITGASGFIGQHLVPLLLKDKHQLLVLQRKKVFKNAGKVRSQVVTGDLKSLGEIKKTIIRFDPQVCLHLAWEGIPDYSYHQSKRNLEHSMNLIDMLAQETNCRKIIVSGSSWEYNKLNFFTWAKNAIYIGGSLLCSQRGVDFIWLRLFFAFGPGQKKHALIPTLYDALKHNRKPDIKNPNNVQDFIYITDVAEALRLAVKKSLKSGIYDIGREQTLSVSEICRLVEKGMGQPSLTVKPGVLRKPADSQARCWADSSEFRRSTGWRPRVSVPQGIKNHIAFLETT